MNALEFADMIERYNAGVMSQKIYEDYKDAADELRRLAAVEAELVALKKSLAAAPAAPNRHAEDTQPVVWVAADTLNSPHPVCVSSLTYMSQIDKDRGREYVPFYAAPVATQEVREKEEMSLREYLHLRRLGLKHDVAADISKLDQLFETIKSGLVIIAVLLGLLAIHSWAVEREIEELEQRVKQESETVEHLSKLIASILNGHPVVDTTTGTAYFIEVSEQKGL